MQIKNIALYTNTGEKIGVLSESAKIELTPEDYGLSGIELPKIHEGITIDIKLDSIFKRKLYAIADSRLANNNWRKMHGLPMWRR